MSITATQLKSNLGYYLALAATETIFISKNGKNIAVLSSPQSKRTDLIDSLRGILPDEGKTVKDYREERLSGKYL
ncbi:MAG: type II toxin-antitoxin system prevent-host-death family antitoxin [Spirochaetales bacterium]|nr:type II toxin-antitoxin system prevent-host-death family antitoxin [Spirochaetales bacterium]